MKYSPTKLLFYVIFYQVIVFTNIVLATDELITEIELKYVKLDAAGIIYYHYSHTHDGEILSFLSKDEQKAVAGREFFWNFDYVDPMYKVKYRHKLGKLIGVVKGRIKATFDVDMTLVHYDKDINSSIDKEYRPNKSFYALIRSRDLSSIEPNISQNIVSKYSKSAAHSIQNTTTIMENNHISPINKSVIKDSSALDIQNGTVEKLSLNDGSIYMGEIINGLPDGSGHKIFSNGDFLKGTFDNGKFIKGTGKVLLKNNQRYEGALIANNTPHGKGQLYTDYATFKGNFSNGKFVGTNVTVTRTYADKSRYIGGINPKGQRHGQGVLSYENGNKISGKFINDQFQGGDGELNLTDNSFYKGKINKDELPHGQGNVQYPNGSYAEGQFKSGKLVSGRGRINGENSFYVGQLNSKVQAHGIGTYTLQNGSFVKGKFKDNKLVSGEGSIIDKGKGKYIGSLDGNFKPHGEGAYYYENDNYFKATFNHGTFDKAYGTIFVGKDINQNRSIYVGELNNKLQPHGEGSWSIKEGKKRKEIKGIYVNGKLSNAATASHQRNDRIKNRNSSEKKYNMDEEILIREIKRLRGEYARVIWSGWRTLRSGSNTFKLEDSSLKDRHLAFDNRLWIWQPENGNSGKLCMIYKTSYYTHHTGVLGDVTAKSNTTQTDDYCPSWTKVNNGSLVSLGFTAPGRNYRNEAIIRSSTQRDVFMIFMHE